MLMAGPSTYDMFFLLVYNKRNQKLSYVDCLPSTYDNFHMLRAQTSTYDMFALIELYGRKLLFFLLFIGLMITG